MEFPETVTQEQLATILGLSTRQLRNLRDDIPPIEKEGRELVYPFPACLRSFVRYREGRVRAKYAARTPAKRADRGATEDTVPVHQLFESSKEAQ